METIEELVDISQIVPIFIKEFVDRMSSLDSLTVIIKGHLYIESLLTVLLEYGFLRPSELDLDRLSFERKVKLAVAAGLIHEDIVPALRKLGNIRNVFAHELWPTFSEKEERDFLNIVRQCIRLRKKIESSPEWKGTSACIWVLWIYLFEQICRTANKRKIICDFWGYVVDVEDVAIRSTGIPAGQIRVGEKP